MNDGTIWPGRHKPLLSIGIVVVVDVDVVRGQLNGGVESQQYKQARQTNIVIYGGDRPTDMPFLYW